MSHSSGTVTFKKDNLVMHCEYDGTSDFMIPALWDTHEEMTENWRESVWNECTCGNFEPVLIHSDYGFGFTWEGEACRTCKAINHEHLDQFWKEDLEYKRQRDLAWDWIPEPATNETEEVTRMPDLSSMLPPLDIVVGYVKVREGAKLLRSKKKRLQKKWAKKNLIVTDQETYLNCKITGGNF